MNKCVICEKYIWPWQKSGSEHGVGVEEKESAYYHFVCHHNSYWHFQGFHNMLDRKNLETVINRIFVHNTEILEQINSELIIENNKC